MPKLLDEKELVEIIQVIASFPSGASIGQIVKSLAIPISRRNVQHRLHILVKNGRLIAIGAARARLYLLPTQENDDKATREPDTIPLSSSSKSAYALVVRPIQLRTPIGYRRDLLDRYRPNVTQYLSEPITTKLRALGDADGELPAGTYAKQIFHRLLIDLSWNSSRLEGNTYSLLETERLLELSEIAEGKDIKETRMILNHKDAIEFIVDSASAIGINRYTVLNLHALLSNDLMGDIAACGRLRSIPVGIAKSVYSPLGVPQQIEECFQQILDTANAIDNPFEQAFFLMVHLPYLQPFEDVNKRVSRLAANIPLIKANLCPLSFVDVPQQFYINGLLAVYELNHIELLRDIFVWAYERSCLRYSIKRKELGDPDPFRLRYRSAIHVIVSKIIRSRMNKTEAIASIRAYVQNTAPAEDQLRLIEAVERDLMSLHEGNIARHRLLPSEYEMWRATWR